MLKVDKYGSKIMPDEFRIKWKPADINKNKQIFFIESIG